MSATFHCDGCDTKLETPVVVGFVTKRDYCHACAEKAQQFVEAEEALRKSMHEAFIDDRAALIAQYSADNFKLPDVISG